MELTKQVGLNIRRLRTDCGLSQEALAFDARIAVNYLSGIERGVRNPTLMVLDRIAKRLRVPAMDLLAPLGAGESVAKNLRPGRRPRKVKTRKR